MKCSLTSPFLSVQVDQDHIKHYNQSIINKFQMIADQQNAKKKKIEPKLESANA